MRAGHLRTTGQAEADGIAWRSTAWRDQPAAAPTLEAPVASPRRRSGSGPCQRERGSRGPARKELVLRVAPTRSRTRPPASQDLTVRVDKQSASDRALRMRTNPERVIEDL